MVTRYSQLFTSLMPLEILYLVSSHLESCFVMWSSHQRFLQERFYLFIWSQFICLVGLHLGGALTQELLELSRENRFYSWSRYYHHPSWRTMSLCSRLHRFKPFICWTIIFLYKLGLFEFITTKVTLCLFFNIYLSMIFLYFK